MQLHEASVLLVRPLGEADVYHAEAIRLCVYDIVAFHHFSGDVAIHGASCSLPGRNHGAIRNQGTTRLTNSPQLPCDDHWQN